MILNRCRRCGCPLDPGERYCDEGEEEASERQEACSVRTVAGNPDDDGKGEKCK